MRVKNKVAIITGGGGGIGRATSLKFSNEGARIIVCDIDEKAGRETADLIVKAGGEAIFVRADLGNPTEAEHTIKSAIDQYGQIDILFNNVGIGNSELRIDEIPVEEWDQVIDVNLKSAFLMMKYAIPHMIKQGGGAIVNTASLLGFKGKKYSSVYNASKGGLITLTKNAALEYGKDNIRVNGVAPGVIDTSIVDHWRENEWKWNIIQKANALGRIGKPEEVANAVLFLASDEASYITGTTLLVDGGGHTF